MIRWRFGESEADGEAWLKNPSMMFVYVDYEAHAGQRSASWRRVVVGTKSWLEAHLAGVQRASARPTWVAIPAMVVVPDAEGEELRHILDSVIQQNALELHSTVLTES